VKLYRSARGIFVEETNVFYLVPTVDWDGLIRDSAIYERVRAAVTRDCVTTFDFATVLAPVLSQEVWAAGVTYYRSRNARMDESKNVAGSDFYDRVYTAERPELFFKATGRRVVGPRGAVRIRSDAKWSAPEPELTVLINPEGVIIGYTIGNDMTSRDIEGENPLYLPQAKIYEGSCAMGPCVLLSKEPPAKTTAIRLEILRGDTSVFTGSTTLAELRRTPEQLARFLFRDNSFPDGAYLMTGTGIVPQNEFSLASGDFIRVAIDGIGVLENYVA
jgi:2-dehydro-3-deoxy-D-arabinonate dehydratase